jgi:hypothetical protein
MMTIQRDLLRDNPETFWQQAANNPQLKDMSREVWAGCPPARGHDWRRIYWRVVIRAALPQIMPPLVSPNAVELPIYHWLLAYILNLNKPFCTS